VEIKLKQLNIQDMVSDLEHELIRFIQDNGYSIKLLQQIFEKSESFINTTFDGACNKIAFSLGGHFTNDGFLNYLKNKYKFDDEQLEKIRGKIEK
jgi:hypothetical protein